MATLYSVGIVPSEYDPLFLTEELRRIASAIEELEPPWVILIPQASEPVKKKEGMVVFADGTNWNPGAGKGLYEFDGSAWGKL